MATKAKVKPGVHIPTRGWKERCCYLVHISYAKENPIHRAVLYTGFLNGKNNGPGGYAQLWCGGYEEAINYSERRIYYLSVIRQLTQPGELDSDYELELED